MASSNNHGKGSSDKIHAAAAATEKLVQKAAEKVSWIHKFFKGFKDIGEEVGFVYIILGGVSALLGKTPKDDKNKWATVLYGMFGLGDERDFFYLIRNLTKPQQELLYAWLLCTFPTSTLNERVVTFWYGNKFRTFMLKLVSEKGEDERVKFLKEMVKILAGEGTREANYQKLREFLKVRSIPLPPENPEEALQEALKGIDGLYQRLVVTNLNTVATRIANNTGKSSKPDRIPSKLGNDRLGWFAKILNKYL